MQHRVRWTAILGLAVAVSLVQAPTAASPAAEPLEPRVRLLGEYSFESGREFQATTVGGLSGLTYDPRRGVYYAISDDRGEHQPARFYTLELDLGLAGIQDLRVVGVTTLDRDADQPGVQPYGPNETDLEDLALTPDDELIVSSERDQQARPWLRRFALDGSLLGELELPERFRPQTAPGPNGRPLVVHGVRPNLGFEGIGLSPDGQFLFVANEQALAQDGPLSTLEHGTTIRLLEYELGSDGWQPGPEAAYLTEPIPNPPVPADGPADNGVSALLTVAHLPLGLDFLALERNYSLGVGNDVSLFGLRIGQARRTETLPALPTPFEGTLVEKVRLARLTDLGVRPDNLEGMCLGPNLSDGSHSLILMSDDNFSESGSKQVNQFVLLALDGGESQVGGEAEAP